MNRIKQACKILVVVPILLVLIGVNMYEDPANQFHDPSRQIGEAILAGNTPYFTGANGDERNVRKCMIENMEKHVDCVTVGPSLSLCIGKEIVGTDSYYNLSCSAVNYYDYMALFALLELNEIQYDRVILCVDSYFFDEALNSSSWSPDFMSYAKYMIAKIEGGEAEIPRNTFHMQKLRNDLSLMLSVTYFQSSLDYIRSNGTVIAPKERWGNAEDDTVDHYLPDGSWIYNERYSSNSVENVIKAAESTDLPNSFAIDRHLSQYYKAQFSGLIERLQDRGTDVELFLCPLSPALWDRLEAEGDHYFLLNEIEEFAKELARDRNLKITGSYDPYNVGISNADYYDARHVRHEVLGEYFDF